MQYWSIKEIGMVIHYSRTIENVWNEGRYIIAELDNGVRIKFLNW